jgi:two-component system, NtrC family, nitrogen regulation response regulator GlnG
MTHPTLSVWIVDDDASFRWLLERALRQYGAITQSFESAELALEAFHTGKPDVLITDIRMPGQSGLELLKKVRVIDPTLPVVVMTAHSDLDSAVDAYETGAFEYLPKPFDIDEAIRLIARAARPARHATTSQRQSMAPAWRLLGRAPAMQQVFRAIARLSTSSVTALITGESGTGKELVARALHEHSPRAGQPFVALNSSAIPAELLEAELFGHEKGAFTGAAQTRIGRFEQAHGGTLFLDEIGDMPPSAQTRLLRVLAAGAFYRVGGSSPISVDVRVIGATHRDLPKRVKKSDFRADLYHRLNVVRIDLPPLRSRSEDIPDLLDHYLRVAARDMGVEPKALTDEACSILGAYDWPGNVRELVNLCRQLTVLAPGTEIRVEDIPLEYYAKPPANSDWLQLLAHWADSQVLSGKRAVLDGAQLQFERTLIRAALRRTQGCRGDAAKLLGWGRNTLTRKLRHIDILKDASEPLAGLR